METKGQQLLYIGMDPKHRENILKNMEKLINETDYKSLKRACLRAELLNKAMINKIEAVSDRDLNTENLDDEALEREQHRRLFKKLTKRGPDAYQKLKEIFTSLGYNTAVRLLQPEDNDTNTQSISKNMGRPIPITPPNNITMQTSNNNTSYTDNAASKNRDKDDDVDDIKELRPYTGMISPKRPHDVIKSTQIHYDDKVGVYPMKSERGRGVLLMVNIIEFHNKKEHRSGAKEDGESLLHLFKELGFKLYSFENLTHKDFFYYLKKLLQSDDVKRAECFVMALMSHGNIDANDVERVQFSDGSIVKVRDILEYFKNETCVNLESKPKIFLFPFCRGVDIDSGHKRTQTDGLAFLQPTNEWIPTFSDMFLCYATISGYPAYRDVQDGSWYIQHFCEKMANYAHNTHFEDIIKMTQNKTSKERSEIGAMQTGNYVNIGFNKKLFFNPGYYEGKKD